MADWIHGPLLNLLCLRVIAPPALHQDPLPLPRNVQALAPPTNAVAPTTARERECATVVEAVGPLVHRAVEAIGPPHRPPTSLPGHNALGFRPSRPPSPALSSASLARPAPSSLGTTSTAALSARTRLQGRLLRLLATLSQFVLDFIPTFLWHYKLH